MGILNIARKASVWRGYKYYKENKVTNFTKVNETCYTSKILGKKNVVYNIKLNVLHPRNSTCNCPLSNGTKIICKHIIATYFTAFPKEAINYNQELINAQIQAEKNEQIILDKVTNYVCNLKKEEAQQELLNLLLNGSKKQYNQFINSHELNEND